MEFFFEKVNGKMNNFFEICWIKINRYIKDKFRFSDLNELSLTRINELIYIHIKHLAVDNGLLSLLSLPPFATDDN